jgi:hypothetical protein
MGKLHRMVEQVLHEVDIDQGIFVSNLGTRGMITRTRQYGVIIWSWRSNVDSG